MIDVKEGQIHKNTASTQILVQFLKSEKYSGKAYTGYPILYVGGESLTLDAIWISREFGVIAFDLVEGNVLEDRTVIRDSIYNKLKALLSQYKELNLGRNLGVEIEVITFAPACVNPNRYEFTVVNKNELELLIKSKLKPWVNADLYTNTISVIQSVVKIKSHINRDYVKKADSKGGIIKLLEETIANLDNQQESAIIEYRGGLQRIRGLAGSGKTIVLALKAAYLHATNPNWKIAVTFNTRALKNQFYDLIELFCIQKTGKKPNLENLKIIQAWGSPSNTGIYFDFCKQNNLEYLDFMKARQMSAETNISPFDFVCTKAVEKLSIKMAYPVYDAILVDEAQDLSESFLNLCYMNLIQDNKGQRRLIYAYDELQTLNEGYSLRSPQKIFNEDANDIFLNKCYRNSRPVLTTAHALGFGIYKEDGLVQFFDEPKLWADVGYEVVKGEMVGNKLVSMQRKELATHTFIEEKVSVNDLIVFKAFKSPQEQSERVAMEIIQNLKDDELKYSDIIVINPLAQTTKSEVGMIRAILRDNKVKSHIAGAYNPDYFFEEESITFTGINRAKGNEVPMVYIINAQECVTGKQICKVFGN
ncbi:hypothetical protein C21_00380 [Arenibacter sp. NBRC 103722]|uniref:DEAD/DEAH box helicase n=1 Tax=Arenibacter sp. NBRC 103722 TaxID=1113929 RepID=UPI000853B5D5|nr:DEAD/DEAH box helicase [Arenibacter sp. NBRC 103722]GBF18223.1 hypothetical protein C21_00380 [Arenibacter sp. NBRC 103722]